jgi:hypothetical protein
MPGNSAGMIGDSLYNQRILEILKNYEKVDLFNQHNFENMLGGTRNRKMILSGDTSYDNEANFGMRGTATGGKKKGLAKTLQTIGRFVKPLGKNLKPIKKALTNRVVQEIDGYDGRIPQDINPGQQVAEVYEIPEAEVDYTYGLPPLKAGKKKRGFAKFLKTVGQFVKPINKELQPLKDALVKKGVSTIEGAGKRKLGGKKKQGFAKFLKTVGQFVKPINKELQPLKDALVKKGVSTIEGAGKRKGGARPKSARGAIVSRVMKEQGLGLGAASKFVKENGLY